MSQTFYEAKIKSIFRHYFDLNHDNFITFEDFEICVERYRTANNISKDDPRIPGVLVALRDMLNQLLKLADTNRDGKISLGEYLRFWINASEKIRNGETTLKDYELEGLAKFTFHCADIDSDGIINENDYRSFCNTVHVKCDDAFLNKGWAKLSQVGPINEAKYVELYTKYFTTLDPHEPGNFLLGPVLDF